MLKCAELFVADLSSKNLHFDSYDSNDASIVKFPYDNRTTTCVFKGEDGTYLSIYTVFERVPEDKYADVLIVCNSLNAKYKWLKFYIDEDNDIMVEDDAILTVATAAEECFELLMRRLNIMNESKPEVMRAIYS